MYGRRNTSHACIHACMCVGIYVCAHTHTCACARTHTHTRNPYSRPSFSLSLSLSLCHLELVEGLVRLFQIPANVNSITNRYQSNG